MGDRCLFLVDFVGPAVGDVTAPGRLVFFRSSMMPVRRMKGGTAWLHQLRRDESVGRIDQKPLGGRTEWLGIVAVFMHVFTDRRLGSLAIPKLSRNGLRGTLGSGIRQQCFPPSRLLASVKVRDQVSHPLRRDSGRSSNRNRHLSPSVNTSRLIVTNCNN